MMNRQEKMNKPAGEDEREDEQKRRRRRFY